MRSRQGWWQSAARLLDEGPGEEFEEGEPLLLGELVAQGVELAARGGAGSLGHGDLPGSVRGGVSNHQITDPGGRATQALPYSNLRYPGAIRAYLIYHGGLVQRGRRQSATIYHEGEKGRATTTTGKVAGLRERDRRFAIGTLTVDEAHDHFRQTLAGSRSRVVRSWHVLRHSFISCCTASKGTKDCARRAVSGIPTYLIVSEAGTPKRLLLGDARLR